MNSRKFITQIATGIMIGMFCLPVTAEEGSAGEIMMTDEQRAEFRGSRDAMREEMQCRFVGVPDHLQALQPRPSGRDRAGHGVRRRDLRRPGL